MSGWIARAIFNMPRLNPLINSATPYSAWLVMSCMMVNMLATKEPNWLTLFTVVVGGLKVPEIVRP